MDYSKEFLNIIGDKDRLEKLLRGSCFLSQSFELWEWERRFIAQAINRDGSILDVGCANGFLLKCLQEWTPHTLTPYGIDSNHGLIEEARRLFPGTEDHFIAFYAQRLPRLSTSHYLPPHYDFVYWAIWDSYAFEHKEEIDILKGVEAMVKRKGRLILGFYHKNRRDSVGVIRKLEQLGFAFSAIIENPDGSEVIGWQDMRG